VVRKLVEILSNQGIRAGGVISGEVRRGVGRVGFSLEDLLTHDVGMLAHVEQIDGPRVGKYRVNLKDVEHIGAAAVQRAIAEADVIVVDELGPMELHSDAFVQAIDTALASVKNVIGTIHKRASHPLVLSIKSNPACQLLEVTVKNRDNLPKTIADELRRHG
jgi:nucleoside-triphosphatase